MIVATAQARDVPVRVSDRDSSIYIGVPEDTPEKAYVTIRSNRDVRIPVIVFMGRGTLEEAVTKIDQIDQQARANRAETN